MGETEIAKWLREAVTECNECGWRGVVLEYLPAFETDSPLAAFGANGELYCPECGEPFASPE